MGQSLFCFKHVTETAGVAVAKIFDDLPRLIVRMVIHHDYFPFEGGRQFGYRHAFKRLG
jgi:hypothetical protein